MANYLQGDTRVVLQPADLAKYQDNGSAMLDSRRTRPLWFDGRFMAARDLLREQNYFLQRQADLAKAPAFGIASGLLVDVISIPGKQAGGSRDTVVIHAGQGFTPAGESVAVPEDLTLRLSDLPEQQALDVQFGVSKVPVASAQTRTGLYLIALRPVQFTANPITAYPTTVLGTATKRAGDIVEATEVALVPWPAAASQYNAMTRNAALARQVFVGGASGQQLSDALLPLAMVSLSGGAIEWLDTWLVRREPASAFSGLRFGLTDRASQQAFMLQYDSQLQAAVNTFVRQGLPARLHAADYFQALPPAGRFPLACIDAVGFTQAFFPAQIDVRLSIIADDELPALVEEAMALPPIDLTAAPNVQAGLTVFALIPVPRQGFAALQAGLPTVPLTSVLPQVLGNRRPIELLRFYRGETGGPQASGVDNRSWQGAIGAQTYGYFIRRHSAAPAVTYKPGPAPTTTTGTTPLPTTTTSTTTPRPTTTPPPTSTPPPTTTPSPFTTPPVTTTPTTPRPTTTPPVTTTPTTPRPTTTPPPTTTRIILTTLRPP